MLLCVLRLWWISVSRRLRLRLCHYRRRVIYFLLQSRQIICHCGNCRMVIAEQRLIYFQSSSAKRFCLLEFVLFITKSREEIASLRYFDRHIAKKRFFNLNAFRIGRFCLRKTFLCGINLAKTIKTKRKTGIVMSGGIRCC